jgi:O-antigen/teichoic acid export membrane protein
MLSYLVLADLGMAAASTKFAGDRYARSDGVGEASVIWTAVALTTAVTSAAALALWVAAPFVLSAVLRVPPELQGAGVFVARVASIIAIARAVAGTVNTPAVVRLRWAGFTLATSGPIIAQVVAAPLVLAAASGGIATVAVVAAGASVLAAVANALYAVRLQPRLWRPSLDKAVVLPLLRYGGPLVLSGIAAVPLVTADRFFLAHFRSTTTVAYYAVAMALAVTLASLPVAVTAPLFPAIVRLHAAGASEQLRRLHRQALQGIFLAITPFALMLALLGGPFLGIWAGPDYAQNSTRPFLIILLGLWFNALAYVPYNYLLASGRTALLAKIHLLEVLPYLAVTAVLTERWGAEGAAVAWTARVILDSALFFGAAKRSAGLAVTPTPERALFGLAAAASLACGIGVASILSVSLVGRAALATCLVGVYTLAMWNWGLTPEERAGVRAVVRELVPRRVRRG